MLLHLANNKAELICYPVPAPRSSTVGYSNSFSGVGSNTRHPPSVPQRPNAPHHHQSPGASATIQHSRSLREKPLGPPPPPPPPSCSSSSLHNGIVWRLSGMGVRFLFVVVDLHDVWVAVICLRLGSALATLSNNRHRCCLLSYFGWLWWFEISSDDCCCFRLVALLVVDCSFLFFSHWQCFEWFRFVILILPWMYESRKLYRKRAVVVDTEKQRFWCFFYFISFWEAVKRFMGCF